MARSKIDPESQYIDSHDEDGDTYTSGCLSPVAFMIIAVVTLLIGGGLAIFFCCKKGKPSNTETLQASVNITTNLAESDARKAIAASVVTATNVSPDRVNVTLKRKVGASAGQVQTATFAVHITIARPKGKTQSQWHDEAAAITDKLQSKLPTTLKTMLSLDEAPVVKVTSPSTANPLGSDSSAPSQSSPSSSSSGGGGGGGGGGARARTTGTKAGWGAAITNPEVKKMALDVVSLFMNENLDDIKPEVQKAWNKVEAAFKSGDYKRAVDEATDAVSGILDQIKTVMVKWTSRDRQATELKAVINDFILLGRKLCRWSWTNSAHLTDQTSSGLVERIKEIFRQQFEELKQLELMEPEMKTKIIEMLCEELNVSEQLELMEPEMKTKIIEMICKELNASEKRAIQDLLLIMTECFDLVKSEGVRSAFTMLGSRMYEGFMDELNVVMMKVEELRKQLASTSPSDVPSAASTRSPTVAMAPTSSPTVIHPASPSTWPRSGPTGMPTNFTSAPTTPRAGESVTDKRARIADKWARIAKWALIANKHDIGNKRVAYAVPARPSSPTPTPTATSPPTSPRVAPTSSPSPSMAVPPPSSPPTSIPQPLRQRPFFQRPFFPMGVGGWW